MLHCHKCGQNLAQVQRIRRSVQTSTTADGSGFFRTVNLCPRCDKSATRTARADVVKKILLVAAAIIGVLASGLYLLLHAG